MNGDTKRGRLIRFSVFELDLSSGELFKQGCKVKLQGQPFELLVALLERPGEVVTREEVQQKVWPSGTVVDFDHGLNRAINKLREAWEIRRKASISSRLYRAAVTGLSVRFRKRAAQNL